ncbi:LamB/YcsF family protein [Demequina muriae]|uniref:5-oxoprolinase subunit PxpA n=1 Tax=Demequina muriae TaxID=3051664 RepID=A0ABT8GFU8_9MICO|nr:5-oxoprolinase subunit PxpA [Demequina sp. EGI L300058]MDN4480300.1 5-oxoprolinase subunit PxpA [Demequina sp. EGI L300058]
MSDGTVIDLNADLGEGFGRWSLTDDDALLESVTSANVACGFHGGDPATMRRVCARAAQRGVVIGAQVSYQDLAGFGRRAMDVPPDELSAEIAYQIGALEVFASAAGPGVAYVKPHGALYHRVTHDSRQAAAVIDGVLIACEATGRDLAVLGLPGSQLLEAAEAAGLPTVTEAFADRAYTPNGTLVPRAEHRAVVKDPRQVVERALAIAAGTPLVAHDGSSLTVTARSLCVHGDTPGAAALAADVRRALIDAGVELRAFTDTSGR